MRCELLFRSVDVEPKPLGPIELAPVCAAPAALPVCFRSVNRLVVPRMSPRLDPCPPEEPDDADELLEPPELLEVPELAAPLAVD